MTSDQTMRRKTVVCKSFVCTLKYSSSLFYFLFELNIGLLPNIWAFYISVLIKFYCSITIIMCQSTTPIIGLKLH